MSDSLWPYGLQPARLLCPWDCPSKIIGMGCHFLLQGIFWPRDRTHVSYLSWTGRWILTTEPPGKPNQWLSKGKRGMNTKGQEQTFSGDVFVHYLYCSDKFMGVCICQTAQCNKYSHFSVCHIGHGDSWRVHRSPWSGKEKWTASRRWGLKRQEENHSRWWLQRSL